MSDRAWFCGYLRVRPVEGRSSERDVVSDTVARPTSVATAPTSTTDAPLAESTVASRGNDEAGVVYGVSAEEQQLAVDFCDLMMRSNELVAESVGAPGLGLFDRDQAVLPPLVLQRSDTSEPALDGRIRRVGDQYIAAVERLHRRRVPADERLIECRRVFEGAGSQRPTRHFPSGN